MSTVELHPEDRLLAGLIGLLVGALTGALVWFAFLRSALPHSGFAIAGGSSAFFAAAFALYPALGLWLARKAASQVEDIA